MIGLILALLTSVLLGAANVILRRVVVRTNETLGPTMITIFLGTIFLALPVFITGEAKELTTISWLAAGSLAGAGIIHLAIGRMLAFTGFRLIGANRTAPILNSSILIATLIGIFLFGEPLTISLVLAIVLIIGGIIFISTTGGDGSKKTGMPETSSPKGLISAFSAMLCWSIAPILVKIGLNEAVPPLVATLISHVAASAIGISLFHPRNSENLRQLDRTSMALLTMAAAITSVAQLLRYIALDLSPVSLAVPLSSISSLFTLPFSFLINRKIESFNLKIIIGVVAVTIGVFFIFLAA